VAPWLIFRFCRPQVGLVRFEKRHKMLYSSFKVRALTTRERKRARRVLLNTDGKRIQRRKHRTSFVLVTSVSSWKDAKNPILVLGNFIKLTRPVCLFCRLATVIDWRFSISVNAIFHLISWDSFGTQQILPTRRVSLFYERMNKRWR
jgi:hypothetical protein